MVVLVDKVLDGLVNRRFLVAIALFHEIDADEFKVVFGFLGDGEAFVCFHCNVYYNVVPRL